jgi:hypothetical protein
VAYVTACPTGLFGNALGRIVSLHRPNAASRGTASARRRSARSAAVRPVARASMSYSVRMRASASWARAGSASRASYHFRRACAQQATSVMPAAYSLSYPPNASACKYPVNPAMKVAGPSRDRLGVASYTSYGFAAHLRHVGRVYPSERRGRVVLVIDNVPWHRGKVIDEALADNPHLGF